jgi:pyruvate dehydrogenase (quinone)
MPPKKTLGQVHDFGVIMLKALLSGRADKVVGLAKVNLTR